MICKKGNASQIFFSFKTPPPVAESRQGPKINAKYKMRKNIMEENTPQSPEEVAEELLQGTPDVQALYEEALFMKNGMKWVLVGLPIPLVVMLVANIFWLPETPGYILMLIGVLMQLYGMWLCMTCPAKMCGGRQLVLLSMIAWVAGIIGILNDAILVSGPGVGISIVTWQLFLIRLAKCVKSSTLAAMGKIALSAPVVFFGLIILVCIGLLERPFEISAHYVPEHPVQGAFVFLALLASPCLYFAIYPFQLIGTWLRLKKMQQTIKTFMET